MRRLHVIEDFDRIGGEVYYRESDYMHDPELHKAFKCGVKEGWRQAMEEQYGGYHERHYGHTMPPMMREHGWPDDEEIIKYRRGRDSRGRYM